MPVKDPTTGRLDLRDEAPFLPESLDDVIELRQQIADLIASGSVDDIAKPSAAESLANAIAGWLIGKANGETDNVSGPTRTRYRKILAALALSVGLVVAGGVAEANPGGSATAAAAAAPRIYERPRWARYVESGLEGED